MLADLTMAELALVAVTAFCAQIIGGMAGYGTGLLMPLVLVPMVGAPAVVPIIALSAIITNATRVVAFREFLDLRKVVIVDAGGVSLRGAERVGLHPAHRRRRCGLDRCHADRARAAAPLLRTFETATQRAWARRLHPSATA